MEQSPSWEANWFSASQEIPRILWDPKVQYRIYKCPQTVSILSQLDPVHILASHFLKIHLNIILQSMPGSYKWYLSLRFSPQKTVNISTLPHTFYTPAHLILFDLIARTILGEEYWSLSSLLCRSLHYPVPSDLNFSSLHITSNTFVVCGCTRTALSFLFICVIYRRCQLLKWCITGGMMTTGESLNTGKNTYTSATYFTLNPMWTHLLFNPCLLDFLFPCASIK